MTIEIKSIDNLTVNDIDTKREELVAFVQEKYPKIDISRGVFNSLVLELTAIFGAKFQTEIDRWQKVRSLKAIQEDPTLADNDAVDHILSNYNVRRYSGTYSTGTIFLEFSKNISYIIPAGLGFTHNNERFVTVKSYVIYPEGSGSTVADRVLEKTRNGGYGCTVDVTADNVGSAGCLKKNTTLVCEKPITSLVTSYAYDDFSGGADTETNTAVMSRLASGMATACWGNRYNIEALIRGEVDSIVDMSIIGYGDEEMQRDVITLFPISTGGKTDLYVKTSATPISKTCDIKASLINVEGTVFTWSADIPSDILPGFWMIPEIAHKTRPLDVTLTDVGYTSANSNIPEDDCFFTTSQNVEAIFTTDSYSSLSEGATDTFAITLRGLPNIDTVQNVASDPRYKPIASDSLVRSAVPCMTTVAISLLQDSKDPITAEALLNIKQNVINYINNTGFHGKLTTAELTPLVKEYLQDTQKIKGFQLTGIIYAPFQEKLRISSKQTLEIPHIPAKYISEKTTVFFTDENSIEFLIENK